MPLGVLAGSTLAKVWVALMVPAEPALRHQRRLKVRATPTREGDDTYQRCSLRSGMRGAPETAPGVVLRNWLVAAKRS